MNETIALFQLAGELKQYRIASELKQEAVAARLGCSPGKVSHFEAGRYAPNKLELEAMCRLYGIEDKLPELEELKAKTSEKGWWTTLNLPPGSNAYFGLEAGASTIKISTVETIPGLLQTPEYALEIFNLVPNVTDEQRKKKAETQARRQQHILRANGPQLYVILSEGTITRKSKHHNTQINHLINMNQEKNITIKILPYSAGLALLADNATVLLSFNNNILPDILFRDSYSGGHLIDNKDSVNTYKAVFESADNQALHLEEFLSTKGK